MKKRISTLIIMLCSVMVFGQGNNQTKMLDAASADTPKSGVANYFITPSGAFYFKLPDSSLNRLLSIPGGDSTNLNIDTGGYVGIGTSAPSERLQVKGNAIIDSILYALEYRIAGGDTTERIASVGGEIGYFDSDSNKIVPFKYLKSAGGGFSASIYNTSSSLDGNRVVTMDGNSLKFDSDSLFDFQIGIDNTMTNLFGSPMYLVGTNKTTYSGSDTIHAFEGVMNFPGGTEYGSHVFSINNGLNYKLNTVLKPQQKIAVWNWAEGDTTATLEMKGSNDVVFRMQMEIAPHEDTVEAAGFYVDLDKTAYMQRSKTDGPDSLYTNRLFINSDFELIYEDVEEGVEKFAVRDENIVIPISGSSYPPAETGAILYKGDNKKFHVSDGLTWYEVLEAPIGGLAFGSYYFSDSAVVIDLTQNIYAPLTNAFDSLFTISTSNNIGLRNDTVLIQQTGYYKVLAGISCSGVNNETFELAFSVNDTIQPEKSVRKVSSSDISYWSLNAIYYLKIGDKICPAIENETDDDDVTLRNGSLTIFRIDR